MPEPRHWTVQDAKARFSELLESSIQEGPQIITKRGVEMAVVVPMAQWRRLEMGARHTLKELLLADEPRFELRPSLRRALRRPPSCPPA